MSNPIIVLRLTRIVLAIGLLSLTSCNREPAAWQSASDKDTAEAYQEYLDRYGSGDHAPDASMRMSEILEARDWAAATAGPSIASFENFLKSHPSSKHQTEAERALTFLKEERDWHLAREAGTLDAFEGFLQEHRNGLRKMDAEQAAIPLREERDFALVSSRRATPQVLRQFIASHPSGVHIEDAERLLVAAELSEDVSALLANIGDGYTNATGNSPGSTYTFAGDIPVRRDVAVELNSFGPGTLSCVGLDGGVMRVLDDLRLCVFSTVRVVVRVEEREVLTLYVIMSDGPTELAADRAIVGTATVEGVRYELRSPTMTWQPSDTPTPQRAK